MYEVWRLWWNTDKLADRGLRQRLDEGRDVGLLVAKGDNLEVLRGYIRGLPTSEVTDDVLRSILTAIVAKGLWRYRKGTVIYYRWNDEVVEVEDEEAESAA